MNSPSMNALLRPSIAALVSLASLAVACGGPQPPKLGGAGEGREASPLGPSYVLMTLPNEDDTLLGRVIPRPPEPGRALEEIARPNPCEAHLAEARLSPMASDFEDAEEISQGAKGRAVLGTFGFSGAAERATHFLYKLSTTRRASRADTTEYEACCKENDCGYGYVSALVYGEGEYAAGEETSASGGVDVAVASASGETRVRVLKKRKVKGWIAAVVRVTDRAKGEALTPLGVSTEELGIEEEKPSDLVKSIYENEKLSVVVKKSEWSFSDGRGAPVTENDFVRRYERVTGSDELESALGRRNTGKVVLFGGLTALGLGLTATSAYIALGTDTDSEGQILLIAGGVVGLGLTIPMSILFVSHLTSERKYDGSPYDHVLGESDARRLVNRYNRKLLRKAIRDASGERESMWLEPPTLTLRPFVGLGGAGISGSF